MARKGLSDSRVRGYWTGAVIGGLLLGATLASGAEVDDLIRTAPGHETYPDAGALVLLDRRTVTVDRNNSTTTEKYLVVKVFEDRARDELGDMSQRYDKDAQVCELLDARTHKPDGTVMKPEPRAVSDVSAPEVRDAMAYTNAMMKVVSFPAIEKNAVLEYRVRVKPKKSSKEEGFAGSVLFGGFYPALRREFRLVVPKGTTFKYAWTQDGVAPVVETLATGISYTWTMTNLPQVFREPGSPDLERMVPMLCYSSFRNWTQVAEHLRKPFMKGVVPTPEIMQLAGTLAVGKSQTDALRALFLYVTRQFRSVSLDYGAVGYEPNKAGRVLAWKYGDCRDKNCLLITLLREAGIKCFPVVIRTSSNPAPPDVPSPDAFDWIATWAVADGKPYLLDPFAEYSAFGTVNEDIAGCNALYLDGETGEEVVTPESDSSANTLRTTAWVDLDVSGSIRGRVAVDARGCYDEQLREDWRDATPTDRQRSLSGLVSGLRTGAVVDSFWFSDLSDLTAPATAGFTFHVDRYAAAQKGELSLSVPTPALVGDELFGVATSVGRHNPVLSPPLRSWSYECNIKLPPGVKVDVLPGPVDLMTGCCRGRASWAKTPAGVVFRSELAVANTSLGLGDYAQLKSVTDALARPQVREVYFLK